MSWHPPGAARGLPRCLPQVGALPVALAHGGPRRRTVAERLRGGRAVRDTRPPPAHGRESGEAAPRPSVLRGRSRSPEFSTANLEITIRKNTKVQFKKPAVTRTSF